MIIAGVKLTILGMGVVTCFLLLLILIMNISHKLLAGQTAKELAAIKADSVKSGTVEGEMDLALLVDGLQAEREQGITIDVAYRFFSTAKRKFIIGIRLCPPAKGFAS